MKKRQTAGLKRGDKISLNARSSANWVPVFMASVNGGYVSVQHYVGPFVAPDEFRYVVEVHDVETVASHQGSAFQHRIQFLGRAAEHIFRAIYSTVTHRMNLSRVSMCED